MKSGMDRPIENSRLSTEDLVQLWEINKNIDSEHCRNVVRALELELSQRPVAERIVAGYLK